MNEVCADDLQQHAGTTGHQRRHTVLQLLEYCPRSSLCVCTFAGTTPTYLVLCACVHRWVLREVDCVLLSNGTDCYVFTEFV